MKNEDWRKQFDREMEIKSSMKPEDGFDALVAMGIIDEEGRVTGHLHRWDAYLAIEKVTFNADRTKVAVLHCRKPFYGQPGGEPRDVTREALIDFMKKGKKIITTYWDQRLRLWMEGDVVRLTPKGFLRVDRKKEAADYLGNVPELAVVSNGQCNA